MILPLTQKKLDFFNTIYSVARRNKLEGFNRNYIAARHNKGITIISKAFILKILDYPKLHPEIYMVLALYPLYI